MDLFVCTVCVCLAVLQAAGGDGGGGGGRAEQQPPGLHLQQDRAQVPPPPSPHQPGQDRLTPAHLLGQHNPHP